MELTDRPEIQLAFTEHDEIRNALFERFELNDFHIERTNFYKCADPLAQQCSNDEFAWVVSKK